MMELPEGVDEDLFFGCYCCKKPESLARKLRHCSGCQLVAYCSRECQKDDRSTHKYVCKAFPVVNGNNALYTTGPWEDHIEGLRKRAARLPNTDVAVEPIFGYPRVCNTCRNPRPDELTYCKCASVCYCSKKCANDDELHEKDCIKLMLVWETFYLGNMRLAYPLSLWNALNHLMKPDLKYIKNLSTLNIHVVISSAYSDAAVWEVLFHVFPKLKEINMIFVIQNKVLNPSLNHTKKSIQPNCKECKSKNKIITSSVHQKPYQEFFSSSEYEESDIVVVYGIPSEESGFNSKVSYHNITNSYSTMLVLMESTVDRLLRGFAEVKAARGVHWINPDLDGPSINIHRGYGSHQAEMEFDADAINEKNYFAVLRREWW